VPFTVSVEPAAGKLTLAVSVTMFAAEMMT
jgi:hypothetical protein